MATIEKQDPVALSQNWGVTFSDYKADGKAVDFQDLMIYISANRATTVEGEVAPLTTRIRKQKTAYEMATGDWSSDVCSSDLLEYIRILSDCMNKGILDNECTVLNASRFLE